MITLSDFRVTVVPDLNKGRKDNDLKPLTFEQEKELWYAYKQLIKSWACSSVGNEQGPHKTQVVGSSPTKPIISSSTR